MSRDFLDHARVQMGFLKSENETLLRQVVQLQSDLQFIRAFLLIVGAALLITWGIIAVHAL